MKNTNTSCGKPKMEVRLLERCWLNKNTSIVMANLEER
jgi:hypothetical protein